MLQMQGHEVSGISLDPPKKSLFTEAQLHDLFKHDFRIDIRDKQSLFSAVSTIDPEVIIHLAAQPLVRESYKNPMETFEINVIGTLNLLESTRSLKNLKATLVITTDKVYKNTKKIEGYIETDPLGGDDPYSASKAAADITAQSWIKNFATTPMAIARAGNVIGGGDWANDRIIPDLVNAYSNGLIPVLRYPDAIRPWQHVLDCLHGYITLVNHMIESEASGEWNFGPGTEIKHSVKDLVEAFAKSWGVEGSTFSVDSGDNLHESSFLLLDSTKSRDELLWSDKLNFSQSVNWTVDWYQSGNNPRSTTELQISNYFRERL